MKNEGKIRGVYSIIYTSDLWTDTEAIDWNWLYPRRWAHSSKEYGGARWYTIEEFYDWDYQVLLEHFGLEQWKEEFPKERVITMSPAELAVHRREKEKLYGLGRKEIINGLGMDHRPAEEYE